ncbi:MAG: DegT/DnrJ/EryC1/StrS family aminotransferase [Sedimenticola sp.]
MFFSSSNPRFRIYTTPSSYASVAKDVLTGNVRSGDDCSVLEMHVSETVGAQYALCMPKARVGIFLAVSQLVRKGGKIILSPYTLSDVINMVLCAGAIPVFADIDRDTCNIDPDQIEKLVDDETDAVLITHLHGYSCDMDRIVKICRKNNLSLIEDAAQAFGAKFKGKQVGTFGDAGIFSFGMYKHVNSFFGGMLVTSNDNVYKSIRSKMEVFPWQETGYFLKKMLIGLASDIATYPPLFKSLTYWIFSYAYLHDIEFLNRKVKVDLDPKSKTVLPESYLRRMTPMQARVIENQLPVVNDNIEKRIEAAEVYHEGLKDIEELVLPPMLSDGSHIYTHYPLQAPDREALIKYMIRNGRDVAVQHLRNCADLDCFKSFFRDCPEARKAADQNILLSTYPRYGLEQVEENVRVIRGYFGK